MQTSMKKFLLVLVLVLSLIMTGCVQGYEDAFSTDAAPTSGVLPVEISNNQGGIDSAPYCSAEDLNNIESITATGDVLIRPFVPTTDFFPPEYELGEPAVTVSAASITFNLEKSHPDLITPSNSYLIMEVPYSGLEYKTTYCLDIPDSFELQLNLKDGTTRSFTLASEVIMLTFTTVEESSDVPGGNEGGGNEGGNEGGGNEGGGNEGGNQGGSVNPSFPTIPGAPGSVDFALTAEAAVPQTGDETPVALYCALFLCAMTCIVLISRKKKVF